ncbi:MAG TPA: sulfotransferase family 2 domain-containing protein [Pseudolabrys sp.]|nr:sulfotransferase family 2 domain-containing protein [Pseudolabrys sp.]
MALDCADIRLNGVDYAAHELPVIVFGLKQRLAYVHNAKAACTSALNFLFQTNHGYMYLDPPAIHASKFAFIQLGPDSGPEPVKAFNDLAPETFSFVRDPLQRLISAFISKILTRHDPNYRELRDRVTSLHGIDLSAQADPARSCLAFAKLVAVQEDPKQIDRHFRPQYLNLGFDGRFRVNTILRLEERDAVRDFTAKWIGADKAQWLLAQKFGATPDYAKDDLVSDELVDLVRKVYARDYELFYG